MTKEISTYIEKNREALCMLLKDLVRVPTINPPGTQYKEIVDLLDERCKKLGMQTNVVQVPEDEA